MLHGVKLIRYEERLGKGRLGQFSLELGRLREDIIDVSEIVSGIERVDGRKPFLISVDRFKARRED